MAEQINSRSQGSDGAEIPLEYLPDAYSSPDLFYITGRADDHRLGTEEVLKLRRPILPKKRVQLEASLLVWTMLLTLCFHKVYIPIDK